MPIKIGTRSSNRALWQAGYTQAELRRIGVESELVVVENQSDAALLRGDIHLAVHAMADLPTVQTEGLVITAVSERNNPTELLLIRPEAVQLGKIFKLKTGAVVGASTALRKAQMSDFRPDVEIRELPDNAVDALQQLHDGTFEAILWAAAEVAQLELDTSGLEVLEISPREFVPAPAQGVLAWQTHRDDLPTRRILQLIHHPETSAVTNIERGTLRLLESGNPLPLGVFVERDAAGNLHAFGACVLEGRMRRIRLSQSTSFGMAEKIVNLLKNE